jgi:hypothetical protein
MNGSGKLFIDVQCAMSLEICTPCRRRTSARTTAMKEKEEYNCPGRALEEARLEIEVDSK